MESMVKFNKQLQTERKSRIPFLDTQTGIAQSNAMIWQHRSHRAPCKLILKRHQNKLILNLNKNKQIKMDKFINTHQKIGLKIVAHYSIKNPLFKMIQIHRLY